MRKNPSCLAYCPHNSPFSFPVRDPSVPASHRPCFALLVLLCLFHIPAINTKSSNCQLLPSVCQQFFWKLKHPPLDPVRNKQNVKELVAYLRCSKPCCSDTQYSCKPHETQRGEDRGDEQSMHCSCTAHTKPPLITLYLPGTDIIPLHGIMQNVCK